MIKRLPFVISRRCFNQTATLPSLAPEPPASIDETLHATKIRKIAQLLLECDKPLILTGAGMSTESGIPDYRSPARINTYKPITYQLFAKSIYHRKRYWARSAIGYERMSLAKPNIAHNILAQWKNNLPNFQSKQKLITQNVDSLHQEAGFPLADMIELHGSLRGVSCMNCNKVSSRDEFQKELLYHNEAFSWNTMSNILKLTEMKPDGDFDIKLTDDDYNSFIIPPCTHCSQKDTIRPSIVFFGENISAPITTASLNWSDDCDLMIILGSSLQTQSSLRLVRKAHDNNVPIIIVNIGQTRADTIVDFQHDKQGHKNVRIEDYVTKIVTAIDKAIIEQS